MKKHILLGAALLSLFAASCSNDDIINNDNEVVTGKTITLNATINNGADTRLAYTDDGSSMQVAWSDSESFTMYKDTITEGSTFTKTAESGSKFKGNDITGEGTYYAVYGEDITNEGGILSIDITNQTGTAADNGIKEFMLASADALTSETTLSFDHKLTVLKMILTLPEDVSGTVSKVTVSGLHKKATYDLSKSTGAYAYTDEGKGNITATNGNTGFAIDAKTHEITAYVAVFPENVSANQVTITAYDGCYQYDYTIANARELAVGKVVPVNVTLDKKKNFKSVYTAADYKTWSTENCGSAVSYDDMCKYLGAGVYYDNGALGENLQKYTLPDNKLYYAGLWLMKKAYIDSGVKGVENANVTNKLLKKGRPAAGEIYKYFFLPITYFYNNGDLIRYSVSGYYWLSTWDGTNAYYLNFGSTKDYVAVGRSSSTFSSYGYLPLIAE